jgi:phosphoglycolate phosphatase
MFIFDLDGTLIDSAPSILAGFQAALKEQGLYAQRPLTADLIGPPLLLTLAALTGEHHPDVLNALAASFKAHYDTEGYKASVVYPGVDEALRTLHQQGHLLHIATNKRLLPTQRILKHLGWDELFASVYASDAVTPTYPDKTAMLRALISEQNVKTHQAIYVGDKPEDGLAAYANGLRFVAVNWGYGDWYHPSPYPNGWTRVDSPAVWPALI